MAIKSSGTISITDIVDEFGGAAPHRLEEYYRNSKFVSNNTYNQNIPTSGAISLGDFYAARASVQFSVLMFGGGGGGGNGFANNSGTGRAPSGRSTGIITKATYDQLVSAGTISNVLVNSGQYIDTVICTGGAGGKIANGNDTVLGTAGASSDFGAGGAGGAANAAGASAPWGNWGAAGGGGGGDEGSGSYGGYNNDLPGEAGTGGNTGASLTHVYELVSGVKYYIVLGGGGQNGTGGNYGGGDGNPGAMLYNINTLTKPQVNTAGNAISDGVFQPNANTGTEALRIKNHVFEISLTNSGAITTTKVV